MKRRPVTIIGGEHKGKEGHLLKWTNWAHSKGLVRLTDGETVIVDFHHMDPIWPAQSKLG